MTRNDVIALANSLARGDAFPDIIRTGMVSRVDGSTYDPTTQTAVALARKAPCRVIWQQASRQAGADARTRDSATKSATIIFSQPIFEPRPADQISVDGRDYDIATANDVSAGIGVVYQITVR